ncbi:MAG: PKD domain-containing protein [Proteiniphilum sp.]|nr:PKD domain-containing protein [Proteiniphilum sp.]
MTNIYPSNQRLVWKGISWIITGGSESNVWVDDTTGYLHMVLRKVGGVWSGINMEDGTALRLYGRMKWVAHSATLNLERNTTIGLCTYHAPVNGDHNEIDIEINQWPGYDEHVWFSNHPASVDGYPENLHYGVATSNPYLADTGITYIIEWFPEYIYCAVIASDGKIIIDWRYNEGQGSANIPNVASAVCMDILPLAGAYFPENGTYFEIVWSDYTFSNVAGNASFTTTDVNSGCATQFIDTSDGSPTAWSWNFGDGYTSTKKNPIHRYASNGTYSVTLTVTTAVGTDSVTQSVVVS